MSTRSRAVAVQAFLVAALALAAGAAVSQTEDIPKRPEQLAFAELAFEPPRAEEYRREIAGGIPVYLAPSRELPLITLSLAFRGGEYLDPPERLGLAALTGALMRQGGTARLSADELDEKLDLLAARVDVRVGPTESSASLDALSMNFEEALALFIEMLREPGFDEGKLAIHKANIIERMKSRNDDASDIIRREFAALMYGRDHFAAAVPAKEMIEAASVAEMRDMHRRIFNPANLIVAASGDFDPEALCARLEQAFAGWPAGEALPAVPAPSSEPAPGIYHVHKEIPQGKVMIGLRGIRRDDPDALVMELMNDVLGGGGFTSRITKRVRSDEGLAYYRRLGEDVLDSSVLTIGFARRFATYKQATL
ncbi:MAG: insulinase family protein, partial [Planctomycetes bacterium]|nr:insulinase family protein [Planctomycetota bacterium]